MPSDDIVAHAREALSYAYEHPETGHIVFDIYDPELLIGRLADEIERLRAERDDIIGYLVWHNDYVAVGPIWPTPERAQEYADQLNELHLAGTSYRVFVVSELPAGGTR